MFYRQWEIASKDAVNSAKLAQQSGLSPLVCDVLAARGHTDATQVTQWVNSVQQIETPLAMHGMEQAVERILRAVDTGERMIVFGDYDVDGVTATAMLYAYLDSVGAQVYYKLPNREDDGYGLSANAVEQLAQKGVSLIVTVDNGISALEAVQCANAHGLDVVVTDHHLPPEELPPAYAIVNPQLKADASVFKPLCGAGVVLKLISALDGCSVEEMLPFYGDLAAIGTVADMMPLEGENRTIVKAGLALLQQTERPGIAALLDICGLTGKVITAENISFGIAPRLNAAGRMDSAVAAFELLLCEDDDDAMTRVQGLEEQNIARQKTEQEITQAVVQLILDDPTYQSDRILVVAGQGFHQGVIGIVASRVVDRFGKPAIIISIDDEGMGKGSGRSVAGLSLYDAIASCSDVLNGFGGHAFAAGLSVKQENIAQLRQKINEYTAQKHPFLQRPALQIDARVDINAITAEDVNQVDLLAPFGSGNPAPTFLLEHAKIEAVYAVSEGKHARLRLRQGNGVIYAVLFGVSPMALCYGQGDLVDAAVSLSVYEGKTGEVISARIKELRPANMSEEYLQQVQLFDALLCDTPLTPQQAQAVLPTREDTALVYRALLSQQKGLKASDLRPFFHQLGTEKTGKILVALYALTQLALVQCEPNQMGVQVYTVIPQQGAKKDLSSAQILKKLEEMLHAERGTI